MLEIGRKYRLNNLCFKSSVNSVTYVLAPLLAIFDQDLQLVRAAQALVVGSGTMLAVWGIARTCAGRAAGSSFFWESRMR